MNSLRVTYIVILHAHTQNNKNTGTWFQNDGAERRRRTHQKWRQYNHKFEIEMDSRDLGHISKLYLFFTLVVVVEVETIRLTTFKKYLR